MLKGSNLPMEMQEPHLIIELGVSLSYNELDNLSVDLIDRILLYKAVRDVVLYGGDLNL